MKIGYARVSTIDQNLRLQIEALEKEGCEKIYQEKRSGKNTNRPALQEMLDFARAGDTVIVCKLDRLGRSTIDLIELIEQFKQKGINFVSLQDNLDTESAAGKLIFTVFAAFAQFERDIISERTKAGLAAARKLGRKGGRKRGLTLEAKQKALAVESLYKSGSSIIEIMNTIGISRGSIYKYLSIRNVSLRSDVEGSRKPSESQAVL